MGAVKISKGIYEYKGYRISNCGYYEPDHCIWWEAVDMKTGCADYPMRRKTPCFSYGDIRRVHRIYASN